MHAWKTVSVAVSLIVCEVKEIHLLTSVYIRSGWIWRIWQKGRPPRITFACLRQVNEKLVSWNTIPRPVPISPKYFFRLNKSLHLFEMHYAFLPLLNPNIDLLQAVKVSKSGHHLSHDRASKGYGSTPCLMSQTSLHACLQRLNTMQISLWHQTRNRPMPLLARSCERWWLDFITFTM